MRLLTVVATSLLVVACGGLFSPDGSETIDRGRLRAHIAFLAADSMYGRRSGTEHELRAARYVRDRFAEYGVQPGVPEYFQSFAVSGGKIPTGQSCEASPTQSGDTSLVSQNVIGSVSGFGELSGQWVVVTAHYDHLGCVDYVGGTEVFNGADDNASGTATMLGIARRLAADPGPSSRARRSVLFGGFGSEEPGLLGSAFFAEHPSVTLDSVVAAINLDMVGRLRDRTLIVVGTTMAQGWQSILENHNADDFSFRYDDSFLARGDHWSFLSHGVPAVALFTGSHSDYHKPTDDVDYVNVDGAARVGELALRIVRALSVQSRIPRQ